MANTISYAFFPFLQKFTQISLILKVILLQIDHNFIPTLSYRR